MSNIITAGNATNNGTSISSDTSGVLELKTGSTPTTALTIDASQIVSIPKGVGGTPAFSATPSTTQAITSGVYTKVDLGTENFDTNNNFASSRFTPTVAGYYQLNGSFYPVSTTSANYVWTIIYKNGTGYAWGSSAGPASTQDGVSVVTTLVYLNGSTDYVELYGFATGTLPVIQNSLLTQFSGFLARAA
jgi:hypothetical protein